MSGNLRSYGELVQAELNGQIHTAHFRKAPSVANFAGEWVDLSGVAGNPPPNFYASDPLVGAVLQARKGIYHGEDVGPAKKFLKEMALCSSSAVATGTYKLLDYLLYYPFIDIDTTDVQVLDNPIALPRYSDGKGVRAMMVAQGATLGSGSFTYDYINQEGIAKTSPVIAFNVAADNVGTLLTSFTGLAGGRIFLPMADGDTGIRQVTAVNPLVPNGGLGALVLVRPLADATIREVNVPDERSYINEVSNPPQILDGAYLNLIVNGASSISGALIIGRATFIWN